LLKYTRDNDVAILAARATAVLYPSLWEGFGIPMLESMTAGTPVVAGNLASMPEVAGPHVIYCDPYDTRDMAAQFLRCLTMEPEERRSLVDAARQHAAQFTWRQSAKNLLAVIEQELAVTGDLREQQQQIVPVPIQLRRQRTVA
jgi:glycosyltransferase involved in cell wall biosynthesis